MKKPDHFNKEIAEKMGVDVTIVKAVNRFFWKEVRRGMPHHTSTFVKNIGTIVISRKKLNRYISDLIERIRNTRKSTRLTEHRKQFYIDLLYADIRMLLQRRDELAKTYYKPPTNEPTAGISETDPPST